MANERKDSGQDADVEKRAELRMFHWEMQFKKNDDGDELCIGTWYPEGIYGNAQFPDVVFFRDYGSHIFTKEECKKLLNGEEITIDHFITKTELEVTIRGKLKEVTTVADQGPCIRFIRTDVNGALRRRINKKLGIEEWSFSA